MVEATPEGTLLWRPTQERIKNSNISRYIEWLSAKRGLKFNEYYELWQWSVDNLEEFWATVWEFFGVKASKRYARVLPSMEMPGAAWFTGAELNYAENVFKAGRKGKAIIFRSESGQDREISWDEMRSGTAYIAAALRKMGVKKGDRVAAFIANVPETVMAFLACASMGAIWSSCSPDFGLQSTVDRLSQITPKVLFATDGYKYNGKDIDKMPEIAEVQKAIPSIEKVVIVPYLRQKPDLKTVKGAVLLDDFLVKEEKLPFEQVEANHPLWILYSSGTTGLPKPIVQSQGGILLEHLKVLSLHVDIKDDDRFFWFTSTGWMMWNFLVSGLLLGATILLYDGSPGYPNMDSLWKFAADSKATYFGASAAYIGSCMKENIEPGKTHDLARIRGVGSTGSPLSTDGFAWVYNHVKKDLVLGSVSGGTDICSLFVGSCPMLPVHAGEIQCKCLGVSINSLDENGRVLLGQMGEMIIDKPMPSMPIYFWNDEGNKRYKESYFEMFPGKWRHGDWLKITQNGGCVIYGRSDSTIKRHGVRLGTSEIYRCVEAVPEVLDSLIVDFEGNDGKSYMPLFVVLKENFKLDDDLRTRIKDRIKWNVSPKLVPDEIFEIKSVPKTLNGKKLEVPVKKILMGVPYEKAVNKGSVSNLEALHYFTRFKSKL